MSDLKKSSISVSDIASQYWCELQMENNYRYGQKITKAMKEGRVIHEELEEEVNIPIMLQPKSYPDSLYKILYTSLEATKALKANKKTREIQLYGSINGYKLVGKIDNLEIRNGMVIVSEDKTRQSNKMPSEAQQLIHRIQVMVYRKLLEDLRTGSYGFQNFDAAYKPAAMQLTDEFKRQLNAISVPAQSQSISSIAKELFTALNGMERISNTLIIRYIEQFTGKEIKQFTFEYSETEMNDIIKYILKYWNGERKAMPVPESEKWKCNHCMFFGKECKVWWDQRVL